MALVEQVRRGSSERVQSEPRPRRRARAAGSMEGGPPGGREAVGGEHGMKQKGTGETTPCRKCPRRGARGGRECDAQTYLGSLADQGKGVNKLIINT